LKEENKQLKQENKSFKEPPTQTIENDPFKNIPEEINSLILSHIHGFDLYNMTKVSPLWMSVVEGNKSAAEEIEQLLTIKIESMKDLLKVARDVRDLDYRHILIDVHVTMTGKIVFSERSRRADSESARFSARKHF
jgi:hypothetical protein